MTNTKQDHDRRRARTAIRLGCIGVGALIALTACGSTPEVNTFASDDQPPADTSSPADSASASSSSLHSAGTLTLADNDGSNVSYSLTWSVPDIADLPASAPDDVLDACNLNYKVSKATLIPIPAQLDITYNGGALPEIVTLVPNELLGTANGYSAGSIAFQQDGGWDCSQPFNLNIDPGQTLSLTAWVLPQLLSNTQPTVTPQVLDGLQFLPGGFAGGGTSYVTNNTSSGPGGYCPGQLFLYGTDVKCASGF